jgi:hypothetical protein
MSMRVMTVSILAVGLSACASSDRLMDANVRSSDHADCLVGNDQLLERDTHDRRDNSGAGSTLRSKRCNPEQGIRWSSDDSTKEPMNVDFKKKND